MSTQTLDSQTLDPQTVDALLRDVPTSQTKARAKQTPSKTAPAQPKATAKPTTGATQDLSRHDLISQWLQLSRSELDALYKKAKPGAIPQGDTRGTAIFAGGPLPKLLSGLTRALIWQGKVFDLFGPDYKQGVVVNKVAPFGLNLIVAKTFRDQSWLDGKDTIVIDYGKTSLLARQIRDEIREVEPGLYLGKVWWGKRRVLDFALETLEPTCL